MPQYLKRFSNLEPFHRSGRQRVPVYEKIFFFHLLPAFFRLKQSELHQYFKPQTSLRNVEDQRLLHPSRFRLCQQMFKIKPLTAHYCGKIKYSSKDYLAKVNINLLIFRGGIIFRQVDNCVALKIRWRFFDRCLRAVWREQDSSCVSYCDLSSLDLWSFCGYKYSTDLVILSWRFYER